MEKTCAVSLENICKSFGGVQVLKNVNFELQKGEVHALVGGNGAGKSTLMKILNGAYVKDSGTVQVEGKVVEYHSIQDAWKCGVRMIYQELSLSPTLTVYENIFLAREMKKGFFLDKESMKKRTSELLNELKIEATPNDIIADLPVGTCQLIEIAKALATDAQVLILDEPTASLTERETQILFDRVRQLKNNGISIVYISHRMKEIFQIADRISILQDGKMVATENTKDTTIEKIISYITSKGGNAMRYEHHDNPFSSEEMFRVSHLTVENTVHDISFSVKKGEVLGLAGLMGSGRTEIVEGIFGLRKVEKETEMYLEGKPVVNRSAHEAAEHGFALIPEDRRREGLVLQHTLEQNACLTNTKILCKGVFISNQKARKFSAQCIHDFQIKATGPYVKAENLSGGNQQKIVIAKWLETKPRLLLMDEPTAGVDIGAKDEILNIVRNYVATGNSCLFISSEMSEMMAICDRILILNEGHISGEIDRTSLLSDEEEILENAIQQ